MHGAAVAATCRASRCAHRDSVYMIGMNAIIINAREGGGRGGGVINVQLVVQRVGWDS